MVRRHTLALGSLILFAAIPFDAANAQGTSEPAVGDVTAVDLAADNAPDSPVPDPPFHGSLSNYNFIKDTDNRSAASGDSEEGTAHADNGSVVAGNALNAGNVLNLNADPAAASVDASSDDASDDTQTATPDPAGSPAPDSHWHFAVSPYLWAPGIHGTFSALNRGVGFRASATDLLSHFRLGFLGAVEARRGPLLLTADFIYLRLGADNALPFPNLAATTANLTFNSVIFTPKIGARLVNSKKLKVDILAGARYWHFGESLSFSPSRLGLNFSPSQNWGSPLVGGRIDAPLSPKLSVTVLGDVGGWGLGSQLEYQVLGALGYKLNPKMTLQAGYRYLNLDYTGGSNAAPVLNLTLSGIIFGVTYDLSAPR